MRPDASDADVRRAFVELARRHHPDVAGGDDELMRAVNEAYGVLADPARRAQYDVEHGLRVAGAPRPATAVDDEEDLRRSLADDRPYVAGVEPPNGWWAVMPAALFFAAVGSFCIGVFTQLAALLVVAIALFLVSCAMFLLAPLWAMTRGRSRPSR